MLSVPLLTRCEPLVAAYSYSMVTTANARDILAAAILFGLPDIAAYAFDLARQSINAENIVGWVDWCEGQGQGPHLVGAGAANGASPPPQFGYAGGELAGSEASRASSPGVFLNGGRATGEEQAWCIVDPGPQAEYAVRLRFFVWVSGRSAAGGLRR